MAAVRTDSLRDRAWTVPLARAAVALVAAVAITFLPNHSASLGLLVFGGFGVVSGIVVIVLTLLSAGAGVLRTLFVICGAVGVVLGAAALLLREGGGLGWFLALVSLWAALTGIIELYAGLRSRGRVASARDWITIGALTVLMAIVFLVIPPDFAKDFTGPDGVHRSLTSSVILVGIFGAYAAIVCVYLAIGAFSLKWATQGDGAQDAGAQDAVLPDAAAPDAAAPAATGAPDTDDTVKQDGRDVR